MQWMAIITAVIAVFTGSLNAHVHRDIPAIDKLKALESNDEELVGVFGINTANDHAIAYRADETFPTGCTSKVIGVAAALKRSMSNPSLLLTNIEYSEEDLDNWSPVTQKYVSSGMTIRDLCSASISLSDNTAMNLLLTVIDGVEGMNAFARSIGDLSFRQDNDWPAGAYSGGVDNVKDSSTPRSMVESLHKLTVGEVLGKSQRDLLITWLVNTQTGAARIRSAVPDRWTVGNKTGTGGAFGTTNDLAIIWPPDHAPILIGVYYTSNNKHAKTREDIVASAARILIKEFIDNDQTLIYPK